MYDQLLQGLANAVNAAAIGLMTEDSVDLNALRNSGMTWQSTASLIYHLLSGAPPSPSVPASTTSTSSSSVVPVVPSPTGQAYLFRFRDEEEPEDPIEVSPLVSEALPGVVDSPRLFQHLFKVGRVRPQVNRTSSGVYSAMKQICGVAMYNLALSLHVAAYRSRGNTSPSSILIEGAKNAYIEATDLLEGLDLSPDGTLIFAFMAACNNLAEISTNVLAVEETKRLVITALWSIPPAQESRIYTYFALLSHVYAQEIGETPPLPLTELVSVATTK